MNNHSFELGDLDTRQENANAWGGNAAGQGLRQQETADAGKKAAEQQRKKIEKEAQWLMMKQQNKIGVKLS